MYVLWFEEREKDIDLKFVCVLTKDTQKLLLQVGLPSTCMHTHFFAVSYCYKTSIFSPWIFMKGESFITLEWGSRVKCSRNFTFTLTTLGFMVRMSGPGTYADSFLCISAQYWFCPKFSSYNKRSLSIEILMGQWSYLAADRLLCSNQNNPKSRRLELFWRSIKWRIRMRSKKRERENKSR
jgi:hypothetical protein